MPGPAWRRNVTTGRARINERGSAIRRRLCMCRGVGWVISQTRCTERQALSEQGREALRRASFVGFARRAQSRRTQSKTHRHESWDPSWLSVPREGLPSNWWLEACRAALSRTRNRRRSTEGPVVQPCDAPSGIENMQHNRAIAAREHVRLAGCIEPARRPPRNDRRGSADVVVAFRQQSQLLGITNRLHLSQRPLLCGRCIRGRYSGVDDV